MNNYGGSNQERLAAVANNIESSSMVTTEHYRLHSTLMKDPQSPLKMQTSNMSPPVMIRENTATGDCTNKGQLVDRQHTMLADP